MAIAGTTTVAAPIAPTSISDVYATHIAKYGKGSWVTGINTISERDAITDDRRELNMVVPVPDGATIKYWTLKNGLTNAHWVELQFGGSVDIVQTTGQSTTSVMSQKAVTDALGQAGGGDMMKSVYDTNNNGIVDNSEKLDGYTYEELPISQSTQTALDQKTNDYELSIVAKTGSYNDLDDKPEIIDEPLDNGKPYSRLRNIAEEIGQWVETPTTAQQISDATVPVNYTPLSTNIDGHLRGIDLTLGDIPLKLNKTFAVIKVRNNTTATILKATPCYIYQGGDDITIVPSRSSDINDYLVDGFVLEDIPVNGTGELIIRSFFNYDCGDWDEFDTLYLDSEGGFTNSITGLINIVPCGFVLKPGTNGIILLDKTVPRDDFPDSYYEKINDWRVFLRTLNVSGKSIKNVADGAEAKDAVNYSQLKVVSDKVDGISGAPQVIGNIPEPTDDVTDTILNNFCISVGVAVPPPANTAINDSNGQAGFHQWRWNTITESWVDVGQTVTPPETPQSILEKIKQVDGEGSGLDADYLDGRHASAFATAAQGLKADSALQSVPPATETTIGGVLIKPFSAIISGDCTFSYSTDVQFTQVVKNAVTATVSFIIDNQTYNETSLVGINLPSTKFMQIKMIPSVAGVEAGSITLFFKSV